MTLKTHATTSLALGLALSGIYMQYNYNAEYFNRISEIANSGENMIQLITGLAPAAVVLTGIMAGGIFPDIDHDESLIYGELNMSWEEKFDRRGIVHTLVNVIGITLPFILLYMFAGGSEMVLTLGLSMSTGCVFHMLLDIFTDQGIMWLYPITRHRFRIPIITNYFVERLFRFIISFGLVTWGAYTWGNLFM